MMQTKAATLQTDGPIIPINSLAGLHVNTVRAALKQGVSARTDVQRPGFYEFEIGDHWYYLHVSGRTMAVYLVAAEKTGSRRCA